MQRSWGCDGDLSGEPATLEPSILCQVVWLDRGLAWIPGEGAGKGQDTSEYRRMMEGRASGLESPQTGATDDGVNRWDAQARGARHERQELAHDEVLEMEVAGEVGLTVPAPGIHKHHDSSLDHPFGDQVVERWWDRHVLRVSLSIEQHDDRRGPLARRRWRVNRERAFLSQCPTEQTVGPEPAGGNAGQTHQPGLLGCKHPLGDRAAFHAQTRIERVERVIGTRDPVLAMVSNVKRVEQPVVERQAFGAIPD